MTTHITAIGSGKGGTGKTLISVSLAHALAHHGERVLLCDADLGLANAAVHLGLSETGDLAGLLAGTRTLRDAVVRVSSGPRVSFDLLAAPSGSGAVNEKNALTESRRAAQGRNSRYRTTGAGISPLYHPPERFHFSYAARRTRSS